MNLGLIILAATLAAVAGGTGLSAVLDPRQAGAIALLAAAASAAAAASGGPTRIAQHQSAAAEFLRLTYSLREFQVDAGRFDTIAEALAAWKALSKRWDEVLANLVSVPLPAHRRAFEPGTDSPNSART